MKKTLFGTAFILVLSGGAQAATNDGLILPLAADIFKSQLQDAKVSLLPAPISTPTGSDFHVDFTPHVGKPLIAIVIDDMGVDRKRTAKVLDLPAKPLTVAYLPYGAHIQEQTTTAREKGHELMVHLPMEPSRASANPGPDFMKVGLSADELYKRATKNLTAFGGYTAVNNHMGSKFTRDRKGLETVMKALKERNVAFLDSRTIGSSIAEEVAKDYGLPTTRRDVFLDAKDLKPFLKKQLELTERIAKSTGSAIAIGHPRDITIAALQKWLPTLEAKGYQLAPLSAVLRYRESLKRKKMVEIQKAIELIEPAAGESKIDGICEASNESIKIIK